MELCKRIAQEPAQYVARAIPRPRVRTRNRPWGPWEAVPRPIVVGRCPSRHRPRIPRCRRRSSPPRAADRCHVIAICRWSRANAAHGRAVAILHFPLLILAAVIAPLLPLWHVGPFCGYARSTRASRASPTRKSVTWAFQRWSGFCSTCSGCCGRRRRMSRSS